jgi:hypothetical protein
MGRKNSLFAITHDGKEMTRGYYSIVITALFNGLVPYEYLVYLFDSLPYREDKSFDYTSYLPWAEGIREKSRSILPISLRTEKSEFMPISLYRL